MIYAIGVAWRNIRSRPVQTFIPSLVIGLAIALTLTVSMLADGTKEGIIQSSDPFGVLLIGANGSSQQLVLNSVLLQDDPVGNIPYSIYEELEADTERVQLAVPLAFGDNVGGARVIGTNLNFFELRRAANEPAAFQIAEGRLFADVEGYSDEDAPAEEDAATSEADHVEGLFEAVLGSRAAEDLGLGIGDQFQTVHGSGPGIASDEHAEVYTVVGILEASDTPYDSAVLTQIESVWEVHAIAEGDQLAQFLASDISAGEDQVTSIMVLPASFAGQNRIAQEFSQRSEAQVAYPGQELVELFDLIDQAQEILSIVGYLVLVIAALTVFLALYNATIQREQAIAIMRGLGSNRTTIFQIILFEALLVVLLGIIIGRVIGYSAAFVIADVFEGQSFLPVPLRILVDWEVILLVLPLVVGALAGLLPAILAYRVNVVEKLFPS